MESKIPEEEIQKIARAFYGSDPHLYGKQKVGFVKGWKEAITWQQSTIKPEQGMKWIDCSSRMPTRLKEYFVIVGDYKAVAIFDGKQFFSNDDLLPVTKWLDEPKL